MGPTTGTRPRQRTGQRQLGHLADDSHGKPPPQPRPHRTYGRTRGGGIHIEEGESLREACNNISTHRTPLSPNRTSHLPPSIAPKPTTHFLHRQFGLTSTKLSVDPTFGAEERSRQTATTSPRPRCTRTNTKRSSFDHQARSPTGGRPPRSKASNGSEREEVAISGNRPHRADRNRRKRLQQKPRRNRKANRLQSRTRLSPQK